MKRMMNSGNRSKFFMAALGAGLVGLAGCAAPQKVSRVQTTQLENPDRLFVVDCLLPAKVQQLGQKLTYLAPRRAVKATQSDCEIRGGEYTAYDRANYASALRIWLPQAQEGNPAAQAYVGEIYEKGLGVRADYPVAAAWYRKAAAQGYTRAMINLGYLYESGLGVEANIVEAMKWYRKASGLKDSELEYVSSIERAKRQAAAEETERLRGEVGSLQQQLDEARRKLQQRQSSLQSERQRAATLRRQLETEKARVAALPAVSGGVATQDNSKLKRELQGAKSERQKMASQLDQQNSEIAKLQTQLNKERARLVSAEAALSESKLSLKQADERMQAKQTQNDVSAAELARLASEKQAQQADVARLQAELREAKKAFTEDKGQLADRLAQSRNEQVRLQQRLAEAELGNLENKALREQLASLSRKNNTLQDQLAVSQDREVELQSRIQHAKGQDRTAQLEAQLKAAQKQSQSLASQVDFSRQEQARLQKSLMQAQSGGAQQNSKIAALEAQLAESESSIQSQEKEIEQLQKSVASAPKKEPAASKVVATVAKGPAIEILDPPISVTRSMPTAFAPPGAKAIDVIGKISSVEQLLTFKINGQKQTVNEAGIFQVSPTMTGGEMPMKMLAIDRMGQKSELQFMVVPQKAKASQGLPSSRASSDVSAEVDFGKYYALVIGNEQYEQIGNLSTPVNDAKKIAGILRQKYGYETKLLTNANRYQILSAMNELRETLTENDNLLIYYAGHGELDSVNLRGFWLPVDAEPENSANWISNVAITDMLNIMSAKHIMVVADSCYSGSLTRSSIARLQGGMSAEKKRRWYSTMSAARTRMVMTSGGVKPVLDSGGGEHSIFARAFIEALSGNEKILEGYQLYRAVQKRVKADTKRLKVDQNPQYAPLKYAGHEAGEFFFLPNRVTGALESSQLALVR